MARDLKWLLAVLNWATTGGDGRGGVLLDRNPVKGLTLPRVVSPRRPIVTPERYEEMLQMAGGVDWRFRAALVLACETGHRIGAIRQLGGSDIDLDRGVVRWPSSGDKIRYEHEIPLTGAALSALHRARSINPGGWCSMGLPCPV